MNYVKLFFEAVTAVPKILDGLGNIADSINNMRDAITEKNIEELKGEVSFYLGEIGNAKSNKDRLKLIKDLNDKLNR